MCNIVFSLEVNRAKFNYRELSHYPDLLPGVKLLRKDNNIEGPMTLQDCILHDLGYALHAIGKYLEIQVFTSDVPLLLLNELKDFVVKLRDAYINHKQVEAAKCDNSFEGTKVYQLSVFDADFDNDVPKTKDFITILNMLEEMITALSESTSSPSNKIQGIKQCLEQRVLEYIKSIDEMDYYSVA